MDIIMKAGTFGEHIGKTYKEIDHALDFLPELPRKLSASALMLLALPVIGIAFFWFVRVPAPVPESVQVAPSNEDYDSLLSPLYSLNNNDDYKKDGYRDGWQGVGIYSNDIRIDYSDED